MSQLSTAANSDRTDLSVHASADSVEPTEPSLKTNQKRILTAPLPDPVSKNIEAIITLHTQNVQDTSAHQRVLEKIFTVFERPAFLYSLVVGLALWMFNSLFNSALPNLPPFQWSNQGLDAAALLISTGVLIRQARQENFAEQRSQLMLQLNLLSEQKIAKIIALLEELREDLPNVVDRHDPEAEVMQEAANPIAVLEALQENLAQELSSNSSVSSANQSIQG
ncbi:MAG TPA: DUF1003 domain-containing protein [Coleofasciculaceae cyanobacterium]